MKDVILEEINVKELELISGDSSIVNKKQNQTSECLVKNMGRKFSKLHQ